MSYARALFASVWAGWQRDFGWTNPILGLSLKTVAPAASVMAACIVYWLGSSQAQIRTFDPSHLAFIMVGAALYAHVAAYSWVPSLAITEGKWSNVFPQIYISPNSSPPYLAGRCLASFATSAMTSIASLVGAYLILGPILNTGIPFSVNPLSAMLLLLALVVNVLAAMGLGFLLSAYTIFATKFEWALPTYISGFLMVFSGALFPVTVLPWPLSAIADVLPYTEFIRAARIALIPNTPGSYLYYLGLSFFGGMVLLALGLVAYRSAEERARRLGVVDRKAV